MRHKVMVFKGLVIPCQVHQGVIELTGQLQPTDNFPFPGGSSSGRNQGYSPHLILGSTCSLQLFLF